LLLPLNGERLAEGTYIDFWIISSIVTFFPLELSGMSKLRWRFSIDVLALGSSGDIPRLYLRDSLAAASFIFS